MIFPHIIYQLFYNKCEELGLSYDEHTMRTGFGEDNITCIEESGNNDVTVETLQKIAHAVDCRIVISFGEKETRFQINSKIIRG